VPYIKYLGSKYLQVILIRKYLRLAARTSSYLVTSSCKHLGGQVLARTWFQVVVLEKSREVVTSVRENE
jgi:hypothetical protein